MGKRIRTKKSKQYTYLALFFLILFLILPIYLFYNIFNFYPLGRDSYIGYFLSLRLPDFLTQLILISLSIIFFANYLNSVDKLRVTIITSVWCFVGACASLTWSFIAYMQYPIPNLHHNVYFHRYILPGLLSSLVLFGTSILFFISRNYTEKKILRINYVKKKMKIDSNTQINTMEKIYPSDLKDLIKSLSCVKCGSITKLSFYHITKKLKSRSRKRENLYTSAGFDAPVCDTCSGLYDSWYAIYRKTGSSPVRKIGIFIYFVGFGPLIIVIYIFIFISLFLLFIPIVALIVLIVVIVRRKQSFSDLNSPYNNVKIYSENWVKIRPDNFKKWASLQNWVLYNLNSNINLKLGEPQLTEIEIILLSHLNEHKGSAFSPSALIKRTLGENFTEEYVKEIHNILRKMDEKGLIHSDYHNGKIHYFSLE